MASSKKRAAGPTDSPASPAPPARTNHGHVSGDINSETATVAPDAVGMATPMPAIPRSQIKSTAGTFLASSSIPMVSSARKQVFRGELMRSKGDRLPVVAIQYLERDPAYYAAEVSALARNQLLCVGPTPYDLAGTIELGDGLAPVIIEEDAGTNLEHAIFDGAPVYGTDSKFTRPLSTLGSLERAHENTKILYDILDQVERLHAHGLYHRDVRVANICVRRFGPRPEDIHATLIDYELVTEYEGTDIPASAERYRRTLFSDLPKRIYSDARPIQPTSLMRDLGYLVALRYELFSGHGIERATPGDVIRDEERPFFRYTTQGVPIMRRLNRKDDIDPLAKKLGLTPLDADHFFDERLRMFAQKHIAPGGHLDERGRQALAREAELLDDAPIDRLARDISYRMWLDACERVGRTPEYDDFESQPELLRASNVDQIRDIPSKLRALGYRMVRRELALPEQRADGFSPEETEWLANLEHQRWCNERLQNGWILGSPRDDARRISPNLVPYGELSEADKEYNRVAARSIIEILDAAGYVVTR